MSRGISKACLLIACMVWIFAGIPAEAYGSYFRPGPKGKDVTISNGSLSITLNIPWDGVVVSVSNRHVAHGLNIVDTHDPGRELQVDQFLFLSEGTSSVLLFFGNYHWTASARNVFWRILPASWPHPS
ncbi:hypothetical protein, partial [Acidithiobacillus thiooxidans]|uniref:hypothetical protein n=1 Tax=Acidithiobacillus thiooxidans TaxID=930 RepID=UPI001EE66628